MVRCKLWNNISFGTHFMTCIIRGLIQTITDSVSKKMKKAAKTWLNSQMFVGHGQRSVDAVSTGDSRRRGGSSAAFWVM